MSKTIPEFLYNNFVNKSPNIRIETQTKRWSLIHQSIFLMILNSIKRKDFLIKDNNCIITLNNEHIKTTFGWDICESNLYKLKETIDFMENNSIISLSEIKGQKVAHLKLIMFADVQIENTKIYIDTIFLSDFNALLELGTTNGKLVSPPYEPDKSFFRNPKSYFFYRKLKNTHAQRDETYETSVKYTLDEIENIFNLDKQENPCAKQKELKLRSIFNINKFEKGLLLDTVEDISLTPTIEIFSIKKNSLPIQDYTFEIKIIGISEIKRQKNIYSQLLDNLETIENNPIASNQLKIDNKKSYRGADFCKRWSSQGNEDADDRLFWIDILQNILGATDATTRIQFQKKVRVEGRIKKIDAYIPETKILIEQKSFGIPLNKKILQSDGVWLTPYEQAKRYNDNLPLSEKAKWIITSNFTEFWIYDTSIENQYNLRLKIVINDLIDNPELLNFLLCS